MANATTIIEQPKFTVIIPLYNCERYIVDCLHSLIAQTESSFEAIVIDDCSTDFGLAAAKATVSTDERFTFYQTPVNSGPSATRNIGLENAKGEIIVFLDADDMLTADALAKIAARFDVQQLDDLYFNGVSFYEDADSYNRVAEDFSHRPKYDNVATGKEIFIHFEDANEYFPQAAMHAYKRQFINSNNLRFKEGIIHEDVLFTFQAIVSSTRCSYLNDEVYQRRIHTGSIMAQPKRSMKNIEGHLVGIHYMQQWINDNYSNKAENEINAIDTKFMQATLHLCNDYLWLCAKDYYSDITPVEKQSYLANLTPAQRVQFESEVGQLSLVYQRFFESRVHQAGVKITAIPKAIRNKMRVKKFKNPN